MSPASWSASRAALEWRSRSIRKAETQFGRISDFSHRKTPTEQPKESSQSSIMRPQRSDTKIGKTMRKYRTRKRRKVPKAKGTGIASSSERRVGKCLPATRPSPRLHNLMNEDDVQRHIAGKVLRGIESCNNLYQYSQCIMCSHVLMGQQGYMCRGMDDRYVHTYIDGSFSSSPVHIASHYFLHVRQNCSRLFLFCFLSSTSR